MLQQVYQPVLVAAQFPRRAYRAEETLDLAFWVANDGPEDWDGCRAAAVLDGRTVWDSTGMMVSGGAARRVGEAHVVLATAPRLLTLSLCAANGEVLARNAYDLTILPVYGRRLRKDAFVNWLGHRLIGME